MRGKNVVLGGTFAALALVVAPRAALAMDDADEAKAIYATGARYQATAFYEEAAEQYERYARAYPTASHADTALKDAVLLRLGLGQDVQAAKDVADYAKSWGTTKTKESASLAYALAAYHAEHGDEDKARAALSGAMEMLDHGPPDLTIRAHALAAEIARTPAVAKAEWAKVRSAWRDPAAAEEAIHRGWPGEEPGQWDRRLARSLNAVGEAYFAAAEEMRIAEVESLKVPRYTGAPADGAALIRFAETTRKDWYVKKRTAIERVEVEYLKLLELRPVPPPRWVIDAGATVGSMWGTFADELRRVPALGSDGRPKTPALHKEYFEAVDAVSELTRSRMAKPAMKKCVDLSVKYQYVDDRSRACIVWLEVHYKSERWPVGELVPKLRATTFTAGLRTAPALPAP